MNRIIKLFNIKYPVIQAGMVWCSGWKLASAVAEAGGLGLIGSGSMYPEILDEHIKKIKDSTDKPFGVNLPLIYPYADEHIKVILKNNVKIVFTSAGNPAKYTSTLKQNGITVAHVISNVKFAKKAEDAGVDVVVAEGFEAGGHNGIEETTTMVLIPLIRKNVNIPLIAAGGINDGKSMLAAFCLGAEGVQIGSRFVASLESSAHRNFKQKVIDSGDGDTMLMMKKLMPVRLLKNKFYYDVLDAENKCADAEKLKELLGKGRARKGMYEGNLDEGELEIGQVSALIKEIKSAGEIVEDIINEFLVVRKKISELDFTG
ncbi:MAG: DUF561 domain-containing protein [Ignavibacteria bacterium]|nr:DUF561 domain-containing protein [Ignavibacteria bacterium]